MKLDLIIQFTTRDWLTIGCFLFVAIGAAIIASYRRYTKPAPPTPMQRTFNTLADDRMRAHRHEIAKHFGQRFGQN